MFLVVIDCGEIAIKLADAEGQSHSQTPKGNRTSRRRRAIVTDLEEAGKAIDLQKPKGNRTLILFNTF